MLSVAPGRPTEADTPVLEIFILKDDIYYHQKDILLHHRDWSDYCKFDDINIYRKYNNEDKGKYKLDNNKLIIEWEKWDSEIFYKINDVSL